MISATFRAWFSMYSKKIHKENSDYGYFGAAYGRSAVLYSTVVSKNECRGGGACKFRYVFL